MENEELALTGPLPKSLSEELSAERKALIALDLTLSPLPYEIDISAFASRYELTEVQAVGLLNSPEFDALLKSMTKAKANLVLNTTGINRLTKIVGQEESSKGDRDAMQAIRLMGEMTGAIKDKHGVNVRVRLEDLVNKGTPGGDVFEIEVSN